MMGCGGNSELLWRGTFCQPQGNSGTLSKDWKWECQWISSWTGDMIRWRKEAGFVKEGKPFLRSEIEEAVESTTLSRIYGKVYSRSLTLNSQCLNWDSDEGTDFFLGIEHLTISLPWQLLKKEMGVWVFWFYEDRNDFQLCLLNIFWRCCRTIQPCECFQVCIQPKQQICSFYAKYSWFPCYLTWPFPSSCL